MLKRKTLITGMLIFAWLPFAEGLCLVPSRILELQSVMNFEAIYPAAGSSNKLNIKGLDGNSACGIQKITTKVSGTVMTINVYESLTSKAGGDIDFSVAIPESVNEVRFGAQAQKIWERKAK